MFAYCNNNPVNCSDSTGTVAKICLTADGRIEDSPWRNHSPGGGGFVYHCNNITTQYDGDKFYTQIFMREAWNIIKKVGKWAWDTYSEEYNRRVETQRIESEMIAYRFSTPELRKESMTLIRTELELIGACCSGNWFVIFLAAGDFIETMNEVCLTGG